MRAMVMAGGRGTRLGVLTDSVPKPLVPLGETTPLDLILGQLLSAGCAPIVVSVSYLGELIEAHLQDGGYSRRAVTTVRDPQATPLGTAGSLALLGHHRSGQLIVSNADIFCPALDFNALATWHSQRGAAITVGYREKMSTLPYGILAMDDERRIAAVEEKPIQAVRVVGGIYVIDLGAVAQLLPAEPARLDMPDLIGRALGRGLLCVGYPLPEPWIDLGTPEQLAEATAYLLGRGRVTTA